MKRENLEKVKKAIEQAQQIEYVLSRINNPDPDLKWDWEPSICSTYIKPILLNLTEPEALCLKELKGALTNVFKQAAERALTDINAKILEM